MLLRAIIHYNRNFKKMDFSKCFPSFQETYVIYDNNRDQTRISDALTSATPLWDS